MTITILNSFFGVAVLIVSAAGLVVVFGLMKVVNFAHGEAMMLGAYVALIARDWMPFWLGIVVAGIGIGVLGVVIERLLIRRLYRRILDTILATWGLGLLIRELIGAFDPGYSSLDSPFDAPVSILGSDFSAYRLFIIAFAAVLLTAMWVTERFTSLGKTVRAVISDPDLARGIGIDVDRVYALSFGTGWLLAGVAGALLAPMVTIAPTMGGNFLVGGFLTTILAGPTLLGIGPAAGLLGGTDGIFSTIADATTASIAVLVVAMIAMKIKDGRSGR